MIRSTLLSLLLPVVITACGGGSAPSAAADTTPTTAAGATAATNFQAYRDCLSKHGVTLPQGGGGPGAGAGGTAPVGGAGGARPTPSPPPGVDQATFDAAQTACASLRPAGGPGGAGSGGRTLPAAYLSCLADHGVAVSTTTTSPGATPSSGAAAGPAIDRSDPRFAAANQVCAALLPARPATSSTTISASGKS
jgi:hypothetical protein